MSSEHLESAPKCQCKGGCDWPCYKTPQGKYLRYCGKVCMKGGGCIHGKSAMEIGAMYGDHPLGKKTKCVCPSCDKPGFFDDRVLLYQRYCSRECRDKKCNHEKSSAVEKIAEATIRTRRNTYIYDGHLRRF